jgi:Flp pilus assembly protein TadG
MSRGREGQSGAETVEFMLTFLLFMLVFFMIVDFAIALYDRGAINNAVREGSRQASLYWVDPDLFDPETPDQNQLLRKTMVTSVMTWAENNLLIDPTSAGLNLTLQINAVDMATATESVSDGDLVSVSLQYPHSYIGLSALAGTSDPTLASQSAMGVE